MRDKELSEWTCRGVRSRGFHVATIDDEVVGIVAYKVEGDGIEMLRLATDVSHRRKGVATKLVNKLERTAAILKLKYITTTTASAQEPSIKFLLNNEWTMVRKVFYSFIFSFTIPIRVKNQLSMLNIKVEK